MRRRNLVLALAALGAMILLAGLAAPKKPRLLLLEWAGKGSKERPPAAILVELGLKDTEPTKWSNRALVRGARVTHREGYCFRPGDRLVDPDGWDVSSHRPLRLPRGNPALARMEGITTVGVVLHLADVADDATLTLTPGGKGEEKAIVRLKDVLAGCRQAVWGGAAVVRLVTTATLLTPGKTEDDFPAAAYGPDGTLWVAYISYHLKDESRRVEQHPYKEQPADFKALYTPEFGDQLFVRYFRKGKWSEPLALTGPQEDLVRCGIAVEGDGTAWVLYSAHRKGRHDIYARPISEKYAKGGAWAGPGPEERLTNKGESHLSPELCTDQNGSIWAVWRTRDEDGNFEVTTFIRQDGEWKHGRGIQAPGPYGGGFWNTSIAANADGKVIVAPDLYEKDDYDVSIFTALRLTEAKKQFDPDRLVDIATSSRFEARPSACYDAQGRLWIAYEEGPEHWGKDYGALAPDQGDPLYSSRSVRVVCLQDGKLFKPAAELPTSVVKAPTIPLTAAMAHRFEVQPRYAYPRLGLDGKGRLWLTYRQKFGTRYSSHPGSYWITFARRLDGGHWTEPIEVHRSDGLLDSRPVLLPHASGGLLIVHNGDGRYTTPNDLRNRIYTSFIDLPGEPVEPKLVSHKSGKKDERAGRAEEDAVERIRNYRIEVDGKKYQLLRGEFHRHTEMSWDGGPDGSLEDMFRYALDAAGMDWIGNGDHDSGAGREYSWWLIQKFTDAYHVKDRFTPMFTYERSVAYPHGHRNCMFAKRGVRTLPRLAQPDPKKRVGGVHADDTKMLYRYLHELDGICAVHTSATGMGTDWRDNDPAVEPFVEIYQGDRMSYEVEGAPRAGHDARSGKKPVNIAGWYPKGFINNALEMGHRLGFESSSDHWSTHISYCVVLAERHDRNAILAALKQRHCYGATDNIILDVHSGKQLMGDAVRTNDAPSLSVRVQGTDALARVEILKDSAVVETFRPGRPDYRGTWTDPKPEAGTHYYYVRVEQKNGQLAWSSPLWFERGK